MKGCQGFTLFQRGSPPTFCHIFDRTYIVCVCVCVCVCVSVREKEWEGQGMETAIIMPARTGVGSKRKKRKEGRRLCLELSKCGSSGPQSLYQCHSSVFSSHLSARRLFFPSQSRKNTHSLTMDGSTQSPTPFFFHHLSCARYLFTQHRSLSKCYSFFFHSFQSLDPIMFVEVQSTEKLPHFTSSAHAISICSLNIRVGCKCHSMSGYLDDLL